MFDDVVQEAIEKTYEELAQTATPKQESRIWKDPKGYQYLAVWQNTALLRVLIRCFTSGLPFFSQNQPLNSTLNPPLIVKSEHRLIAQMDDAARSVKRNIEEGFKRPTTKEYLIFLGYSQASLEELKGDIRDCKTDGLLKPIPNSSLTSIGIDLRVFKGPVKGQVWGEPDNENHPWSFPLKKLRPADLSYEIFMELINKTDFLLRKLVISLEDKLASEKKYYQVEQVKLNRYAR